MLSQDMLVTLNILVCDTMTSYTGIGVTMDLTPFQEGVIAAKSGYCVALNPYIFGTDAHDAWIKGHAAVEAAFQLEIGTEQSGAMIE